MRLTQQATRWILWLFAASWMLALPRIATAAPDRRELAGIPEELKPWVEWVKPVDPPPGECRSVDDTVICVWPNRLELELGADGGSFTLEVVAHAAETVALPGSDDAWPQGVAVDRKPALVLESDGEPTVRIEPGRHRIEGRFLWRELPGVLAVPSEIALVDLIATGTRITFPKRTDGLLDLPRPSGASSKPEEPKPQTPAEPEPNAQRLEVSRLLEDGVPLRITTHIALRISGEERELALPYPLWDDAKLIRIDSDLPLSLDANRNMVLEVRSGTYQIALIAHLPRAPERLGPPALTGPLAASWPEQEVWVWNARPAGQDSDEPSLGQVVLGGESPIDRTRTHAPTSWPAGATYAVSSDRPLTFEVLQRGVSDTAPDSLRLAREAVFDLEGKGWFVFDTLEGALHSANRLDQRAGPLGSVTVDGQPQVVTLGQEGHAGVELRQPNVQMFAQWRAEGGIGSVPLGGWSATFETTRLGVRLPPGWDLFYASGPGNTSKVWIERWDVVSAVLLLGLCVAIGRWVDRRIAVVAFVGLVLTFDASDDAFVVLLGVIGALVGLKLAMDRPLPAWAHVSVRAAWAACALMLVLWVVTAVPQSLDAVWHHGAPALGALAFEEQFDDRLAVVFLATLIVGSTFAVAWVVGKARGVPRRFVIAGLALVGALALGATLMTLGGSRSGVEYEAMAPEYQEPQPMAPAPVAERDNAEGAMAVGDADDDVWGSVTEEQAAAKSFGVGGLGLVGTGRGGGGTAYLEDHELPPAPPPEIPQTGQAEPSWTGPVWTVVVDREVEPDAAMKLWLVSPAVNLLIAAIRAAALAGMALLLALAGWPKFVDELGASAKTLLAVAVLFFGAPALAEAAPPKELLDELKARVNATVVPAPSPKCGTDCALVSALRVGITERTLTLDAELHMAGPGVYGLPGSFDTWMPTEVTVDGSPAEALAARNQRLVVRLEEGLHRVVMRGPVAGTSLSLSVGAPKRVEVTADGWTVAGIDEHDTATHLQFAREGASEYPLDETVGQDPLATDGAPSDDSKVSQDLPAWLYVDREIDIGPRWTVKTTVTRLNAGPSPLTIKVPLLEGEQMIESSRPIDDPKATLTLASANEAVTWTSVLDPRAKLILAAPAGPWTERWVLSCDAAWQCDAQGIPPTRRDGARRVYHPWPGELLEVALFKPVPAEGPRLSVDDAALDLAVDEDDTTATLTLSLRSSTVGERTITIPEEARLQSVAVDGHEVPTSKQSQAIRLTFQPGDHLVRMEWKQDEGVRSVYSTPAVSLGGEAIDARVTVTFNANDGRVVLHARGDGHGPRAWLGPWLCVLVVVALLLHAMNRDRRAVRLHDWFLLGLGVPSALLPLVVLWLLWLGQRRRFVAATARDTTHNAIALATMVLSVVTAIAVIATVRPLLLDGMATSLSNLYTHGNPLSWYVGETSDAMPQGSVWSVSPSLWRGLWVAWVAWFGWRCVAWVRWARAQLRDGGGWRWPAPAAALRETDTSGEPADATS